METPVDSVYLLPSGPVEIPVDWVYLLPSGPLEIPVDWVYLLRLVGHWRFLWTGFICFL